MTEFEVSKSDVDGWDVRRKGESQALTNHATREEAEAAAKIEQEVDEQMGSGGDAVDIRQGPFSDAEGSDELDGKKTLLSAGVMLIGVIALIVIISLIVALTNFGG
jgi:hypothetical protein